MKKRAAKHGSNGFIITEELREELDSAIASTQQAYTAVKSEALTGNHLTQFYSILINFNHIYSILLNTFIFINR